MSQNGLEEEEGQHGREEQMVEVSFDDYSQVLSAVLGDDAKKDDGDVETKSSRKTDKIALLPEQLKRWYLTGLPVASAKTMWTNVRHDQDVQQQEEVTAESGAVDPRNLRCFFVSAIMSIFVYSLIPGIFLAVGLLLWHLLKRNEK